MVLSTNEVIEIVQILSDQNGLKVSVQESGKAALFAGLGVLVGGLLGGKNGILAGGAVGTVLGHGLSSDFKSVAAVIQEDMSIEDRQRLAVKVKEVLNGLDTYDMVALMGFIASRTGLKDEILKLAMDAAQQSIKNAIV